MYSFVCFVENLIYFQYKLLRSVNSIALQFIPDLCFRSAWLVDWSQVNSLFNSVHHFFNSLSLQICYFFTCSKIKEHITFQIWTRAILGKKKKKVKLIASLTAYLPDTASHCNHALVSMMNWHLSMFLVILPAVALPARTCDAWCSRTFWCLLLNFVKNVNDKHKYITLVFSE